MKKIFLTAIQQGYLFSAFFAVIICFVLFGHANVSFAGVNLPWSTTFNCAEQAEDSGSLSCDGMSWHGNWNTASGNDTQITTAANNPIGGGGRGERFWIGDGTNNNSATVQVDFNTPQTGDVYIRWYMRFENGKHEAGALKVIYLFDSGGGNAAVINFDGSGQINLTKASTPSRWYAGTGWGNTFYTGRISDGTWVEFEARFGVDTGIFQMWVNGVLEVDDTGLNYGSDISKIYIGENQKVVAEGRDMYIDYDDVAISNTGYIGPIGSSGGGSTPAPSPTSPTTPYYCHLYDQNSTIPTGYGAPYNIFTSANELLIKTLCPSTGSGQATKVEVGSGSSNQYIYNTGYLWRNNQWQQVNYTGSNTTGSWIIGNATASISLTSQELQNTNYLVAYTCTWTGSDWKCGCRDQSCITPMWQLQAFGG